MRTRITLELSEARAMQLASIGDRLKLTSEQVLHLALNLCLTEWKEIFPDLSAYEVLGGEGPWRSMRH